MHRSKEELKAMDSGRLVDLVLQLKSEAVDKKREMDSAIAELQTRAEQITSDRNIKYTEFYGSQGCCSVTTAQSFEILNLPRLRELLGAELVDQKVAVEIVEKQKLDNKFKEALTAVFMNEYNTEYSIQAIVKEIASTYALDSAAGQLLVKKLKGDYKKDRKTLIDVLGIQEEDFNLDEELYYIYQIKKYELIKAFLDEEKLPELVEQLKKCMVVEETVKVEVKPLADEVA